MDRDETEMNETEERITLTVKAFATLREVMDSELTLTFPKGATVRMLLAELTGRFDGLDELLFTAPDTLRNLVNIIKNGRNIEFLAGLETPLEGGDVIALFPPVAGG